MLRLALKIIFGNRMKFYSLVAGLTFAVLLIVLLTSIYCGVLQSFFNTAYASGVPIWVMDATTPNFDRPTALPEHVLNAVRSVRGVQWAEPFYMANATVRLEDGSRQAILLIGVSTTSYAGLPQRFLVGGLEALHGEGGVAIDKNQLDLLHDAKVGTYFELNDRRLEIRAVLDIKPNLFSLPVCFVSEREFLSCFPTARQMLSYVLVAPVEGIKDETLCRLIMARHPTLKALPQKEFGTMTSRWYEENTNAPFMFMVVVVIGMVFSVIITAQQFYTFVLENINCIAVLKSMGYNNLNIGLMLLAQIFAVGFAAYGISLGAIALLGIFFGNVPRMFYYTPVSLLFLSGLLVLAVCLVSSQIGIFKMRSIEPAAVFRM